MKNKDFILIGIDAPIELRFKRLLERNRIGDAKTLEEFKEQEQREKLNNATNQQLDETFKLSNKIIINNGTLEELHKKVYGLIKELK
jgi:dephospho-CoA kinase